MVRSNGWLMYMENNNLCPLCNKELGNAPGIGPVCDTKDCPVSDDADLWSLDSDGKPVRENSPFNFDIALLAGDSILMNEQAKLLRECRAMLDELIEKKVGIESLVCGSTTIGNLRAELHKYRPQGVFGK